MRLETLGRAPAEMERDVGWSRSSLGAMGGFVVGVVLGTIVWGVLGAAVVGTMVEVVLGAVVGWFVGTVVEGILGAVVGGVVGAMVVGGVVGAMVWGVLSAVVAGAMVGVLWLGLLWMLCSRMFWVLDAMVISGVVGAMVGVVGAMVISGVLGAVVKGVVGAMVGGVLGAVVKGVEGAMVGGLVGAVVEGISVVVGSAVVRGVVAVGAVSAVGAVVGRAVGSEVQQKRRGATAVDGNIVYVTAGYTHHVWAYDLKEDKWTRLLDCPHRRVGLAVVNGMLTAVGGERNGAPTNALVSLTDKWAEHFPPMQINPRRLQCNPAVVCTGKHLVVVVRLDRIVHVMDTTSLEWFSASSQPLPSWMPSLAVCGTELYALDSKRLVFSCSLPTLLQSSSAVQPETTDVWQKLAYVPVEDSTLTTLCGELIAVGGRNERSEPVDTIQVYDRSENSWHIIGHMPTARYDCLVATLLSDTLVVIGGVTREGTKERRCDVVEVTSHV